MKYRDSKTDDVYMISDRKGWRKTGEGQKMTLELNEEQRAELARLRALDAKQKARVLELLENTLSAADVHVFLNYEPHTETVRITFNRYSAKPEIVVNVNMDNAAAMLYDIFKQAGPELVAEA